MQEDQNGSGDQAPAGGWVPPADEDVQQAQDAARQAQDPLVWRDGDEPAGHDAGIPHAAGTPASAETPRAPALTESPQAPQPPQAGKPDVGASDPGALPHGNATAPLPAGGDHGQPAGPQAPPYPLPATHGQPEAQTWAHGQPGGYGQPGAPGQPGGYGQAGGYGPPGGNGPPGGYGPPGSYGGYGGYGAPPPADYIQQGPAAPGRGRGRTLVTYVVVAALAAGIGAGAVLAIDHGSARNSAADQQLQQRSGLGRGIGTGLSRSTEQAIVSKVNPGLVDITSNLGYSGGTAEATGMIISPSGLVLTNNHVIDGSTNLTAAIVTSGRHYHATVVGYDRTDDVAVIKLTGAAGLKTVPIGNSSAVKVGNSVVALGNADGQGGAPHVVGSITGLNRTITASDEGSATGRETLHGMLRTSAAIVPGDSGGPLANVNGQVIGMNTAAATGSLGSQQDVGFAIPANKAVTIARQIETGQTGGGTITIGLSGFLGVLVPGHKAANVTSPQQQRKLQLKEFSGLGNGLGGSQRCLVNDQNMAIPNKIAPVNAGVLIDGALCNTAAAAAGVSGGDVIISVDGHAATSPTSLTNLMVQYRSGQQVTVVWVDPSGHKHTSGMTLTAHPPY